VLFVIQKAKKDGPMLEENRRNGMISSQTGYKIRILAALVVFLTLLASVAIAGPKKNEFSFGCLCGVDEAKCTLKLVPWDQKNKKWLFEAPQEFRYDDNTKMSSGKTVRTVSEIKQGQAFIIPAGTFDNGTNIRELSDLVGERTTLYWTKEPDIRRVVDITFAALFIGESMAAMVGEHSATLVGRAGACPCGSR
jgi:hypothetical protein